MPHMIGARSFEELADFAIELCRRNGHRRIVCGPITSGGLGNIRDNLELFAAVIFGLIEQFEPHFRPDQIVLNQLDFEPEMWTLWQQWKRDNPSANENPIMEQFYKPLFSAVEFPAVFFLPGWETSNGARHEREIFKEQGRAIMDIHQGWAEIALRKWRARPDSAVYLGELFAHAPEAYGIK